MDMYARVLREAVERGARVAPWVRFYIQCGSQDVKRYCQEMGYLEIFARVGATFLEPSCGACINAGPGVSKTRDEDRKSTRLNSSHGYISYAVFCLKKKTTGRRTIQYNTSALRVE